MLRLTFGSMPGYTAPMPIQFILPKKFTRAQIEWRVDELALQFQGTKDKKIIAQIANYLSQDLTLSPFSIRK